MIYLLYITTKYTCTSWT